MNSKEKIIGFIDGLDADFIIGGLKGEDSYREVLFFFDPTLELEVGDIIRYRPVACPLIHFAKILKIDHRLVEVHIVSARERLNRGFEHKESGLCQIKSFHGQIKAGRVPEVGETVRFIPSHCMMQKVHTGVVVMVRGREVLLEGIDIKVWSLK